MALASATEHEDSVKKASRIYKFIEYGTVEMTDNQKDIIKNA